MLAHMHANGFLQSLMKHFLSVHGSPDMRKHRVTLIKIVSWAIYRCCVAKQRCSPTLFDFIVLSSEERWILNVRLYIYIYIIYSLRRSYSQRQQTNLYRGNAHRAAIHSRIFSRGGISGFAIARNRASRRERRSAKRNGSASRAEIPETR